MNTEVVMPRLSDTMETGVVGRWLRRNGEFVGEGDPLVEIETDKTTTELVASHEGFLSVLVSEGETVPTGGVLARVVASAEEVGDIAGVSDPASRENTQEHSASASTPADRAPVTAPGSTTRGRLRATPVARKLAAEAGIGLDLIRSGSGPEGRIHRIDIERFIEAQSESRETPARSRDQLVEPSRIHTLIARKMTRAKQEVPHYYVTAVVDMTETIALKRLAASLDPPSKLSVSDVVIFACARALATHPAVNASWVDDQIVRRGAVNVGVAVALSDAELVVPVIHDADELNLVEVSEIRRELTRRARQRELRPPDVEGGTFTITNLGPFGVSEFHAIINPPESGILALGKIEEQVVAEAGQSAVRPRMTMSLSADHRVYSGAAAAAFLSTIQRVVEHPSITLLATHGG